MHSPFQKQKHMLLTAFENDKNHQSYIFSGASHEYKCNFIIEIFSTLAQNLEQTKEKVFKENHPDYFSISPVDDVISVEQIREIPKQIRFQPLENRKRFIVIQDAHQMNMQAANAFLKIYEEPPVHSVFFLLVPDLKGLPQTILSRSLVVRFPPTESTPELGQEFSLLIGRTKEKNLTDQLIEQQEFLLNFSQLFLELFLNPQVTKPKVLSLCEKSDADLAPSLAIAIEILIRDLLLYMKGVEKPVFIFLNSKYKKIIEGKNKSIFSSLEELHVALDRLRVAREFHGSVPLNLMNALGSVSLFT